MFIGKFNTIGDCFFIATNKSRNLWIVNELNVYLLNWRCCLIILNKFRLKSHAFSAFYLGPQIHLLNSRDVTHGRRYGISHYTNKMGISKLLHDLRQIKHGAGGFPSPGREFLVAKINDSRQTIQLLLFISLELIRKNIKIEIMIFAICRKIIPKINC